MHKTDGKLFWVAAPIPGAGARGGRGGGPRDGRQHRANQTLPVNGGERGRREEGGGNEEKEGNVQ